MEFLTFKTGVASQFSTMVGHKIFRTNVTKEQLWDTYINSFPEGSNPIFRERTEHDCNCCRQFIKTVGNIVAIIDGKLVSIWDCQAGDPNYQVVADALSALVKSQPIVDVFLHTERTAGTNKTYEDTVDRVVSWDHFFINIPRELVVRGVDLGTALNEARGVHDVLLRGLNEITDNALDTVLDLINQNSLHRGAENKFVVWEFKKLKHEFNKLPAEAHDNFAWLKSKEVNVAVAKIRGSAIGTLLLELSEGKKEVDECISSFEAKVSGGAYKRPKTVVIKTKAMIEGAQRKIEELGLTSALERRYATLRDISVNDVLFADRSAKPMINGNVFSELASAVATKKTKSMDKVEEINIDKFLSDILPTASTVDVLVENSHSNLLVSLIAPVDPTAGRLFKWDNNFSWSYTGDMADSVKERVKKAGGNVTGDLCCRLAWSNYDDLDVNMTEPDGHIISYCRKGPSASGGRLDVDMHVGRGTSRSPVENIFYSKRSMMKEGIYTLCVNNFSQRELKDVGFVVELDYLGEVYTFAHDQALANRNTVSVVKFNYTHANGIKIISSLPSSSAPKTTWEVPSGTFRKVEAIMLSPNYWEGSGSNTGNKHYFFMLEGCANDGSARGFYNEFLRPELDAHRKVLEIVGSKMRTEESGSQLSGLGFSSTQRNSVLVRVGGSFTRIVKVLF